MHNLVDGYVFWTVFSFLPPMIWFYPLNQLELSGYEIFVLVLFSPLFLKFKVLIQFAHSNLGYLVVQSLINLSLLSFQAKDTFHRLCCLSIGAFFCSLKLATDLSQWTNDSRRGSAVQGYTVGFMAMLASRVAYRTIMPAFNDHATNWAVFAIAFSSTILKGLSEFRPQKSMAVPPVRKRAPIRAPSGHLLTGAAFGTLLYLKLSIFGEISVPFRWLVAPFPDRGPDPNPWALLVLVGLVVGYFVGIYFERMVSNLLWNFSGFLAFLALYKLNAYEGLVAACLLAVYVGSLWTSYCNSAFVDCSSPALPFLAAMFFYLLPAFYSVWTVAYNFVPLGEYSREFTGLTVAWVSFWLSLDNFFRRRSVVSLSFEKADYSKLRTSRLWAHTFLWFTVACAAMTHRFISYEPAKNSSNDQDHVTVMLWTFHFGYDNGGWPSLERSAQLIRNIDAGVVGLLETDASRLYMGNNDLAQWLSETLNLYVDYGPPTKKHTWGCMLLSKYPVVSSAHHLLPSPRGELAPAISAVLNVQGQKVGVVLSHMGNDRDDLDRRLQAEVLSDLTSHFVKLQYATILLAYVTSYPYQRDYNTFVTRGMLKDIDPSDRDRFCEYIFYQNLHPVAYGRISKGHLSDTEIQTAKFALKFGEDIFPVTIVTDFKRVPEKWRFSAIFGSHYDGHYPGHDHRFHMGTPKYFLPGGVKDSDDVY